MGFKMRTPGITKWTKKRKTTDSKIGNPVRLKKKLKEMEKNASFSFEKEKKTPLEEQQKKTPLEEQPVKSEHDSDSSETEESTSSEPEVTTFSKSEVTTKPEPEVANKPENARPKGEICPRGKQWKAAAKFCIEIYKLSVRYLDDYDELRKLRELAEMTAQSVKWCNIKCPGPLITDDEFLTPWGPNDENRYSMFEFLREVEVLEKLLSTECLKPTDTEGHDKVSKAKQDLRLALGLDPVLDYIEPNVSVARKHQTWTREELQRIKFIYRVKRWYKRGVSWDEMLGYFNDRSMNALRKRYRAMGKKAKAIPMPLPKREKKEKKTKKAPAEAKKEAEVMESSSESSSAESEDSSAIED